MNRRTWTPIELDILRRNYADSRTEDIALALGRSIRQIYQAAARLGLRKSAEYLAREKPGAQVAVEAGRATRFRRGHTAWNKGMKGLDIGGKDTRFKPGNRSGKAEQLYKPIGTIRTSKDGILQIKVNDDMPLQRRWRSLHSVIWEREHGPIPDGHVVVFRNGNRHDVRLENLECISRVELQARNTIHRYPRALRDAIKLAARIRRQIHEHQQ